MADKPIAVEGLEVHPLTEARWPDVEQLFSERGVCSHCWCMWWRITQAKFMELSDAEKQAGLHAIVASGLAPGLLAYRDSQPVGWCSVGPRESYGRLERSPRLKRLDDKPVWSIVCFFVAHRFRRQGVSLALVRAALAYAKANGARIVEGYPTEPLSPNQPDAGLYMGVASSFREAGFVIEQLAPLTVRYYFV